MCIDFTSVGGEKILPPPGSLRVNIKSSVCCLVIEGGKGDKAAGLRCNLIFNHGML